VADKSPQKWDYVLLDVDYVDWSRIDNPKKRAKEKLDPDVDWEKLVTCPEGWQGLSGVWVARDPTDGYGRPSVVVLQGLGRNGWEVVGVQTRFLRDLHVSLIYNAESTYVLKRALAGSAGE
jgi:hypothetical protein